MTFNTKVILVTSRLHNYHSWLNFILVLSPITDDYFAFRIHRGSPSMKPCLSATLHIRLVATSCFRCMPLWGKIGERKFSPLSQALHDLFRGSCSVDVVGLRPTVVTIHTLKVDRH